MTILLIIIGLALIILVHEAGHFLAARLMGIRVLEFGFGFPPRLWSREVGGTLISLNALPFGGFVRLYGEDAAAEDNRGRAFVHQPFGKKAVTLLAGVFMNVLFGWLMFSLVFSLGIPEHLLLAGVSPDSPAAAAGLMPGDVVFEAAIGPRVLTDPVRSGELIAAVKEYKGQPVQLVIRGEEGMRTVSLVGRTNPPPGEGPLGVELSEIGFAALSLFPAVREGFRATVEALAGVTAGFWELVTSVFTRPEILQSVAGPVGIVNVALQAGSLGTVYLIQLLALISLNLAVLNLIPFPALDGGRFILALLERARGIAVPSRIQIAVNAVGIVALMILMVVVTIQDIGRIVR
ncbi:MAG: site-2 protease family protein [Patescibacteria group bacterium]